MMEHPPQHQSEFAPEHAQHSDPAAMPLPWFAADAARLSDRQALLRPGHHATPLLICDYDGTLAPFQLDKMQAVPYPGVADLLAQIAAGPTRLAFVSGRPVAELIQLLPLAAHAEIWGMHGREHRLPDGTMRLLAPSPAQKQALDTAEAGLRQHGFAEWIERKTASVALHWRSLHADTDAARLREVQSLAHEVLAPLAGRDALGLLPFDGGLELRAEDHTKGHATEALVRTGSGPEARPIAFLGDDTTDEDAFRVMRRVGGLGILVREPARPSFAQYSLRPPEELLRFLEQWLASCSSDGRVFHGGQVAP